MQSRYDRSTKARYSGPGLAIAALAAALGPVPGCGSSAQPAATAPVTAASVTPPATTPPGPAAETAPGVVARSDTPLLPRAITSFGAAVHDGGLYVLGGYTGEPHSYSLEGQSGAFHRLDLTDGTWRELPGVEHLQSVALVAYRDTLIRVGGMRARNTADQDVDLHSLTEVARYHPATRTWEDLPPLPHGRSSHDAVILGDTLYVLGGWKLEGDDVEDRTWHTTGLALDLVAERPAWREFPVPFSRRAFAVAAAGHDVYAIGGMGSDEEPSRRVDVLDTQSGAWRRGPDFPEWAFGLAAVGIGDVVYAGGRDGTVFRLGGGNAAWQAVTTMMFPRFFHRLVAAGDHQLIAVGGIGGMTRFARVRQIERIPLTGDRPGRVAMWTLTAPGPAKNRQGAFLRGTTLHVFGGNNSLGQHDFAPANFLANAHKLHLGPLAWEPMKPYPVPRQTVQTAVSEDGATGIALGGFGTASAATGGTGDGDGEARTHGESYLYDFEKDAWTARPGGLPAPRSQFGLARHGDTLWVFGGLDYDPARPEGDRFRHLTPVLTAPVGDPTAPFQPSGVELPGPRRAFGGAVLGGRYYLVGGMRDGFQTVEDCAVFDFATRTFAPMASPRRPRLSPQLVALGDKLYLAGGKSKQADGELAPDRSIEVYDPKTDTWTVAPVELPIDPTHMHMFPFHGRLLVYTAHTDTDQVHLLLVDPR